MTHFKFIVGAFALFILVFNNIQAQDVIPATGGNANGSGGSVNYTVGQFVYTTLLGTNGSVAQGVQQPFEISIVSGTDDIEGINLKYTAFPNPTTDYLTLKIENSDAHNLTYQLFDVSLKLIESKKILGSETKIYMGNYLSAVYILRINQENKIVKTFKIVKQ